MVWYFLSNFAVFPELVAPWLLNQYQDCGMSSLIEFWNMTQKSSDPNMVFLWRYELSSNFWFCHLFKRQLILTPFFVCFSGSLMYLNEATLLNNIKNRYNKDKIYVSKVQNHKIYTGYPVYLWMIHMMISAMFPKSFTHSRKSLEKDAPYIDWVRIVGITVSIAIILLSIILKVCGSFNIYVVCTLYI